MVVACSESGIDFGKSMSTYIQDYLGLSRNCRMFEIKQACYSGTAGLQMAFNLILSQTCPGAKALVIGTDISRFIVAEGGEAPERFRKRFCSKLPLGASFRRFSTPESERKQ